MDPTDVGKVVVGKKMWRRRCHSLPIHQDSNQSLRQQEIPKVSNASTFWTQYCLTSVTAVLPDKTNLSLTWFVSRTPWNVVRRDWCGWGKRRTRPSCWWWRPSKVASLIRGWYLQWTQIFTGRFLRHLTAIAHRLSGVSRIFTACL